MVSRRVEDALQLLRAEYHELPGLALTSAEIQRLLNVEAPLSEAIIDALVYSRFLERTTDGRYVRPRRESPVVAAGRGRPTLGV